MREDYHTPEELGQWVLQDFTSLIERLFPEGPDPDPLDRDAMDHEAFARRHRRVYVGRSESFDRLTAHADGTGDGALVIVGEPGSGKSALLANWAERYRRQHDDVPMIQHYVTATACSTDPISMLRRLAGEIKRRLNLEHDLPEAEEVLSAAFPRFLEIAAAKGRLVLLIDALDQLEDRVGGPDLVWLPTSAPTNIRLIVSTLPGRSLNEVEKRRWPVLEIGPLKAEERRDLARSYLAQYGKNLGGNRIQRIVAAAQTGNPLFLRVLLNELRQFGEHARLDESIVHYLGADGMVDLYNRVMARWEDDYGTRTGLVGDALSLLWVTRCGVSEAELLQALGSDGEPLPAATWSPLYLAMSGELMIRSGLLSFGNRYVREAVESRYLAERADRDAVRLRLAEQFYGGDCTARTVDELPFLLADAGAWERLRDLLVDPDFFDMAWGRSSYQVMVYWATLEAKSQIRMVTAYRGVLQDTSRVDDFAWSVGILFWDSGHPEEACALFERFVTHYADTGDKVGSAQALGNLAGVLQGLGRTAEAFALHEREEQTWRGIGDNRGLATCLGSEALILQLWGRFPEALERLEEQEALCRTLNNIGELARCLLNTARIRGGKMGAMEEAETCLEEAERLYRTVCDPSGLMACLVEKAMMLQATGANREAVDTLVETTALAISLGDRAALAACYGNLGLVLDTLEKHDLAADYRQKEAELQRELGDKVGLAACLASQGAALSREGDTTAALTAYQEAETLQRESGDGMGLAACLCNQAIVLEKDPTQRRRALGLVREAVRLAHGMGASPLVAHFKAVAERIARRTDDEDAQSSAGRRSTPADENQRGLGLMRAGGTDVALGIFRELAVDDVTLLMRPDVPIEIQANFVTALLMTGNIEGATTYLEQITDPDHPCARELRERLDKWRCSLSWTQRLGLSKKPPIATGPEPGFPL